MNGFLIVHKEDGNKHKYKQSCFSWAVDHTQREILYLVKQMQLIH